MSSWPSLISDVLVVYNLASDWPRTFLQPGCFCLGTHLLVTTVRDALQTLRDDIPTQKYPVSDFIALVILSELVVLPLV